MDKLKCYLQPVALPNCISTGFLILRLIVGVAFIIHGYGKMQAPMSWMGPDSTIPGFFLLLASISEFFGGIALLLGLVTRLAAFGIGSTMTVAVYMHSMVWGDSFVSAGKGGSFELPLTYLALMILFLITGPGRFSLDSLIFKECDCTDEGCCHTEKV